ncbi:MAG: aromatic amino acid lyase [Pseudomonadota bacterium]
MTDPVELSGAGLTIDALETIAGGAPVTVTRAGRARMQAARDVLMAAIAEDRPMYGITTGLGPRVVERLSPEAQVRMSLNTIRGRAHAVGEALPVGVVRAAMAIRINGFLTGASGSDPALADLMAGCLNAGLTPVIGATGSIGAADLMWGGMMGLALIGEGEMDTPSGRVPSAQALAGAGLQPYAPGPREGLAMVSHSATVAGVAAMGLARFRLAFETLQTAAALSLEGFRGNLTPFDPDVLATRPQPGQEIAAAGIRERLQGSLLTTPGHARRVQDPLSMRNIPQIHGAVLAALEFARDAVETEINGASDNPVVLPERDEILSSGGYLTPHLTVALTTLNQAIVHAASAQVARIAKTLMPRFTELPVGLASADVDSAGIAPATKTSEALFSEIVQLAQPSPVYPSGAADGVEDVVTHSAVPAKALHEICDRLAFLSAMELMIGTQAVELRALEKVAPRLQATMVRVRQTVAPVTADRSLSADIENLATVVRSGAFA